MAKLSIWQRLFPIRIREWGIGYYCEYKSKHSDNPIRMFNYVFNLKCGSCNRFTTGCKDHSFCGMCEICRIQMEE